MEVTDQKSVPEKGSWGLLLAYVTAAVGAPSVIAVLKWSSVAAHPLLGAGLPRRRPCSSAWPAWLTRYGAGRTTTGSSTGSPPPSTGAPPGSAGDTGSISWPTCASSTSRGSRAASSIPTSATSTWSALRPNDPGKISSSDLADLPATGQRSLIGDFLGRSRPRVLAVIGAPGSGKTTLLRHTAREMCLPGRRRTGRDVPILLYLRDHVSGIVAEPGVALPALVAAALDRYGLADPVGWLEQRLQAGDCVVMLDGLDEVARAGGQAGGLRVGVGPGHQVPGQRLRGHLPATRLPERPDRGRAHAADPALHPRPGQPVLHGWYLAEERHRTGIADDSITRRAAAEAEDLLGRLKATPALRDLTVNPLLLTMIATVHKHGGALPGSRADLYAQICQVLLWRRQGAKKLQVEPRGEQKERLMRVLALEMMRRSARDLSRKEVLAILRPALRRINRDLAAEDVLDDAASNGLFVERETGLWAFAHQTFQEYLAAARIKERHQEAILTDAVSDIWWRETTLLYVAGADAGPIIEACLAAKTVPPSRWPSTVPTRPGN